MKTSFFPTLAFLNIVFFMGASLQAQTALSWPDCLKEASLNNLDLLSAEQSVKAAEDTHIASLGQFFPQISFDAQIGRKGYGGFNDAINTFNSPPRWTKCQPFPKRPTGYLFRL